MILSLRVYGLPVAQGRPRAFKLPSGQVRVYDPEKSRDWKRTVLHQVLQHKPSVPVGGPLSMLLSFDLPRPKSLPKREQFPTKRPDLSNMLKAIEDALCGVVYLDDAQIVDLSVTKRYGETPGVVIVIDRVATVPAQAELVTTEGRR